MNISKSKYIQGINCSKKLWLSCYKPEEAAEAGNEAILESGRQIGEYARGLFGDYILIDHDLGLSEMLKRTQIELQNKPNIICEASFNYDGNFCSVDILKNDPDGVEIYEVKSSNDKKEKEIYLDDISYQTWVLKKCGLNVKKSCLVTINSNFVKNGEIDLKELFKINDLSESIDLNNVEGKIKELKAIAESKKEPNIDLSMGCHKPDDCPYFKYCTKDLPSPNVFDIGWNLHFDKKLEMYRRGNITFEDVLDKEVINDKATQQIKSYLNPKNKRINKEGINDFLSNIRYPLYFLDFESYEVGIPTIDGTKPYQQICFQYSLHYYLEEGGKLYHKEYLSDDYDGNQMYGLCKQLCEDIPKDSCVIAYHKSFECNRLKEMANLFPEFKDHLLNISNNIVDIEIPFKNQDYYIKDMAGRSSIKVVLPALYPDDPELDYHNLKQVHRGDEASASFLSLSTLSKEEQEELRENMLKYCSLDTYATVKLLDSLKEAVDEKHKVLEKTK